MDIVESLKLKIQEALAKLGKEASLNDIMTSIAIFWNTCFKTK